VSRRTRKYLLLLTMKLYWLRMKLSIKLRTSLQRRGIFIHRVHIGELGRGATTAEKLRGTKVWVTTPRRLRPAPGRRLGWRWVREGVAPPAKGVRGGHPRKIFENSDAKSCILVASALISGLPRTCISEQTTSMSRAKSVPKF